MTSSIQEIRQKTRQKTSRYLPVYEDTREHFKQRLKERYEIEISDEEYDQHVNLISSWNSNKSNKTYFLYRLHRNAGLWYVYIKCKWVLVIYKNNGIDNRPTLKTCLLESGKLPVPLKLRLKYNESQMEEQVNLILSKCYNLISTLNDIGEKKFFTEYKEQNFIKAATIEFRNTGVFYLEPIIRHLVNTQGIKYKSRNIA